MSFNFDGIEHLEYPASLYQPVASVEPINGYTSFDSAMLDQYREVGFVSIKDALTKDEVDGVLQAMLDIVIGEISDKVELQFESEARGKVENLGRDQYLDYVRKFMWFSHLNEVTKRLMYKPEMVVILEQLLGGEVEMFQDMALLKPPGIGREKPWHQDHAYFNLPKGTPVVGVWIALDEATPENGCMHFLPGGHHDGPIPHWNRRDWQICDTDILEGKQQVAAPLPVVGALIFDGLTPHGTPSNRTNTRRRAIQWHYVRKGTPRIPVEERLALFGSEGRNVSC
jgi:phytanoyl-CoA hydroxylase